MNRIDLAGPAAVLVSLDSKQFPREWVRSALAFILARHDSLMFLLADDLLAYTRSTVDGGTQLSFSHAAAKAGRRHEEVRRFLQSEIRRLDPAAQERVTIRRWRDFSDSQFVSLLRSLHIAFACTAPWRVCVEGVAREHLRKAGMDSGLRGMLYASSRLILDEVAMCLRVTELDSYHHEYYPSLQIEALASLYSDRFAADGLSVESLIGKERARDFKPLMFEPVYSPWQGESAAPPA